MPRLKNLIVPILLLVVAIYCFQGWMRHKVLEQIISRLEADSRVAQVLVTSVDYNETYKKNFTTIKFLEFDSSGKPMKPRYFTFPGNIIQFQSLVVRFDDRFVQAGDRLRGKSVYLFWKVFCLDGNNTKEFPINDVQEIPGGYKVEGRHPFEEQFWREFWRYALDPKRASGQGVKNAQIEAPGTMFVPGYLYTIKIEHDGGLRIDTAALPEILSTQKT